ACSNLEENASILAQKRDKLIELIKAGVPDAILTGHPTNRLPGNASFAFPGTEGESLVMQLDRKGICASSGSACSSSTAGISHVLEALNLPETAARGSLRLTLGHSTSNEDIELTAQAVCAAVKKIKAACALRKEHRHASGKHGRI
nr:aminotransferase class V-fold PLP-dependent enzyme [bacterium]